MFDIIKLMLELNLAIVRGDFSGVLDFSDGQI